MSLYYAGHLHVYVKGVNVTVVTGVGTKYCVRRQNLVSIDNQ